MKVNIMNGAIITAIKEKNLIKFIYKERPRLVEPYHIGVYGNKVQLHAYDAEDYYSIPGWKNFIVSEMQDILILPPHFKARADYSPNYSQYKTISLCIPDYELFLRYWPKAPRGYWPKAPKDPKDPGGSGGFQP
jgi:predicted DNA-binding transcriptional regulator YafY